MSGSREYQQDIRDAIFQAVERNVAVWEAAVKVEVIMRNKIEQEQNQAPRETLQARLDRASEAVTPVLAGILKEVEESAQAVLGINEGIAR